MITVEVTVGLGIGETSFDRLSSQTVAILGGLFVHLLPLRVQQFLSL